MSAAGWYLLIAVLALVPVTMLLDRYFFDDLNDSDHDDPEADAAMVGMVAFMIAALWPLVLWLCAAFALFWALGRLVRAFA